MIPSCRFGSQATNLAATGARSIPPAASPATATQLISRRERFARKAKLAQTATINSAALTVPIIFRGSVCVVAINVGVTTGPQPPPP